MSDSCDGQRQCPTRTDGRLALFTHRVTASECQSRQRGMFHRCFSCAYNNSWVARHGLPAAATAPPTESAPAPAAAASTRVAANAAR